MHPVFRIILNALAWIPFAISAVLFGIIIITPLYLYRVLVTVILRWLLHRRDFVESVKNPDNAFSADDIWNSPKCAIAFVHVVQGELSAEKVMERIREILESSDLRRFRRLTSLYPVIWLGYSFWKKLEKPDDFDLKNHIQLIADTSQKFQTKNSWLTDEVLKWLASPFIPERPLWDTLILSGFTDSDGTLKSVFGFRIHHMVGDGYSMLDFLNLLFTETDTISVSKVTTNIADASRGFKGVLKMLFWIPEVCASNIWNTLGHRDFFSCSKTNEKLAIATTSLKLKDLKELRLFFAEKLAKPCSFFAVILFIFGEAMVEVMSKGSRKCIRNDLGNINMVAGLSKKTPHPTGEFCNHWHHGVFTLFLTESSSDKRLERIVENVNSVSNSAALPLNSSFTGIFDIFPRAFNSLLLKNLHSTTVGIANLPGPSYCQDLCGQKILSKLPIMGLQMRHASFTLCCFSYNGTLAITMISNAEVISVDMSNRILNEEFHSQLRSHLQNRNVESFV